MMDDNIISDAIGIIANKAAPSARPGDYTDHGTGLLFCGRCHTPRQCSVHLFGRQRIVGCTCTCERETWDKEQAAKKAEAEHKRIEAIRAECIPDPGLRRKTFSSSDNSRQLAQAKAYVGAWERMREHNIGMLFWGSTGAGKTHTAACAANALIDRGIRAGIASTAELLAVPYSDRATTIRRLIDLDLLVLDDLGAERGSEYAMETVYAVVDGRTKAGRPMVITTNLSLDDIKYPADMGKERIYQRVLECCQPVRFVGESRRPEVSAEKRKILAEIFGEARP